MLQKIMNSSDKVYEILKMYPAARDSDLLLYLIYLDLYHGLSKKIGSEGFLRLLVLFSSKNVPPPESIRRNRQKIQESGIFVGTKRKKRKKHAEEVRSFIGYYKNKCFF